MIEVESLRFRYPTERFELRVPSLRLDAAGGTAIIGPSGCGKTTLLRLAAGILRPIEGRVTILDEELARLSEDRARAFRARHLGLVFQEFELLDYLTVLDNVLLPYHVSTALELTPEVRRRARELAEATGIAPLLGAFPRQLSQGERQRTAICRALVTRPRLILADEPTGSLDPANQQRIVALLHEQAREAEATLVMVTHDHELLGAFEHVVDLPEVSG